MTELAKRRCVPCEGGVKPLDAARIAAFGKQLDARWTVLDGGKMLKADFEFENYYQTTAFVNAVAWIAHREDHHPDIAFGYRTATVAYWTHAVGGLSDNDFICAAKVDALLK
ncbi:MAG: 4a-hydroxytetrahydrobiopterin dehydratase [Gammaproteobacteria bacterium]|nr:4a-hydroxytetrahydrobiopterin dehydratase [Gammaproteobacteria bacterium]